jgi:hypothetical protein
VIVHGSDVLRGRGDPHGVFVGTWRERGDIEEIVEILTYNATKINGRASAGLEKIRKEIDLKSRRPTPKTIQSSINEAAKRMADEIDREVLQQSMANVPYETLVPSLIKAIQELNDKVKQLESK